MPKPATRGLRHDQLRKRQREIAYSRTSKGSLVEGTHCPTGGRGSGGTTDPLGSQGSLTLSRDRSLRFAVNAGTGNLSVFRVRGATLDLSQVISSGGSAPVAVAQHDDLVYVANFAGNSNVVGFRLDEAGCPIRIPNSIRYLSATNTGPFSLAFSPDGHLLLLKEKVTEKHRCVFSRKAMDRFRSPKSHQTRFLVSSMWSFLTTRRSGCPDWSGGQF